MAIQTVATHITTIILFNKLKLISISKLLMNTAKIKLGASTKMILINLK